MTSTYVSPEAVRRLRRGNPWVYREEIIRMDGTPAAGEPVQLRDELGEVLGLGDVDLDSPLAIRRIGSGEESPEGLIPRHLREAVARRAGLVQDPRYCRLVNDDGDGLPGLVVDRYDSHCSVQTFTRPMDARTDEIARSLVEVLGARSVLLRNDSQMRARMELPSPRPHVLFGTPPRWTRLLELSARITVDLTFGAGTGYAFDLRHVRRLVRRMSQYARVLDLRCGVGGLLVHAGLGGARSILAFETDPDALDLARENSEANGLAGRVRIEEASPAAALTALDDHFDLVLLDLPRFYRNDEDPERAFTALLRGAIRVTRRSGRLIVIGYPPMGEAWDLDQRVAAACEEEHRYALRLARPSLPFDFPTVVGAPGGEHLQALALELG